MVDTSTTDRSSTSSNSSSRQAGNEEDTYYRLHMRMHARAQCLSGHPAPFVRNPRPPTTVDICIAPQPDERYA
jgi:hypothetical protein